MSDPSKICNLVIGHHQISSPPPLRPPFTSRATTTSHPPPLTLDSDLQPTAPKYCEQVVNCCDQFDGLG
ncbi:hypothetical protein HanRHA438_Chr03g0137451 [Helianthus annuus]|nr:hypothetical protein HanIR_Chr03g0137081 [Helianthus annuus]KAJ0937016.1 hypothetical protein HanRHA438_Chr03g0137451 [Helianthus annuus]